MANLFESFSQLDDLFCGLRTHKGSDGIEEGCLKLVRAYDAALGTIRRDRRVFLCLSRLYGFVQGLLKLLQQQDGNMIDDLLFLVQSGFDEKYDEAMILLLERTIA